MKFRHGPQVHVGKNVGVKNPERGIRIDPLAVCRESSRRTEQVFFMDHTDAYRRAVLLEMFLDESRISMQIDQNLGDPRTCAEVEPDVE